MLYQKQLLLTFSVYQKNAQAITTVCRVYRVNPSLPPTPQPLLHPTNLLSVAGLLIFRLPPTKDMQPPTDGSRVARQARSRCLCHQQGEPARTNSLLLGPTTCETHSLRLQAKSQSLVISSLLNMGPCNEQRFFRLLEQNR